MPPEQPPQRTDGTAVARSVAQADGLRRTLRLPGDAVVPAYGGGSILNLPPSIGSLLGVEEGWDAPPLDFTSSLADGDPVERLALVVLDGFGATRLRQQRAFERRVRGTDRLADLLERYGGKEHIITSVSPATTSVATTCLLGNGASPARSGLLGYTQRMPELGVIANMLLWRPAYDDEAQVGSLRGWGSAPESFLPTPSIFQVLGAEGVAGTAWLPQPIMHSPLSRMQLRGAAVEGTLNLVDTFCQLGRWFERTAGSRAYAYVYYPDFDSLGHRDGPGGGVAAAPAAGNDPTAGRTRGVRSDASDLLYEVVLTQLERLLEGLSPAARRGTRVLVTADHGMVGTPLASRRLLRDLPTIASLQSLREAGEARHLYLHARSDDGGALRQEAERVLGGDFVVLDGPEALAAGLYGDPASVHPEALRRIGDVIVLARGQASLWGGHDGAVLLGMHGALDAEEMLVPLLSLQPAALNR